MRQVSQKKDCFRNICYYLLSGEGWELHPFRPALSKERLEFCSHSESARPESTGRLRRDKEGPWMLTTRPMGRELPQPRRDRPESRTLGTAGVRKRSGKGDTCGKGAERGEGVPEAERSGNLSISFR